MAAVEELLPHPSKPYVLPARNTFDVVGINDVAALLTAIDGVNPFDVSPGMQLILERFVIRPDSANPFVYTTNVVDVKPDEIPSSVDAHGNTPLHLAAASGHILGVRILLERCACDVNAVNEDGWTPMHVAALHGRVENVEQLLRHGAKPTQPIAYNKNRQHLHAGRTALFLAHKHQHHAVVALLRPFCERISPLPPLADDGCISSDAIINVFLKAVLDLDVVVLCHIFDVLDCLHSVCGSMPLLWPHKLLPGLKGVGPAILPHVVPLQAAMMDAQLFVLDALVSRHMIEVGEPHLPPSVGAEDGTSTSEPQQQPQQQQEEEAANEEACAEPCAASAQDELSLLQRILNGGQVEALRMLLRTDANILRPRDPPLSSFIPAEGPNASTREELRKLIVERELKHEFDVAFAALKKKHHSKTLRRDAMEAKAAWREAQKELAELGLPLLG